MKKYCKEIQDLADRCAQEVGNTCFAAYWGRTNDFFVLHGDIFVFQFIYADNLPRCDGFPKYITVMDGQTEFHSEPYTFGVFDEVVRRYNQAKGRKIYIQLESKVRENNFVSDEEREYATSIVNYHNNPFYAKWELYAYLEAADRLNMRLELFVEEYDSINIYHDGIDEKSQFLRLIKK